MKTHPYYLLNYLVAIGMLLLDSGVHAQSLLDRYVHEGLQSNLVIQQRNVTLQQAQQSLLIARSYFLPSVRLLADYISGEGGRSINIPVGDLLNPVYASLNQLTGVNGFPHIENTKQTFFPNNFYDARVRTSLPLLNTDLYINRSIQAQQIGMKQQELDMYKRQLVADIKAAYFSYMMATQAVKIYESARALVRKNVEINESLLKNGKTLPATYLRSKSEEEKVTAELTEAFNKQANARKYFNFLLNKPLDNAIEEVVMEEEVLLINPANVSIDNREEVKMVHMAQTVNELVLQMSKLNQVPKINAFIDLGSQAYDWNYNGQSRYYLFGIQFSLPLFEGFRNKRLIFQNKLELQKSELHLLYTRNQLQLAAEIAGNYVAAANQNYLASHEQLKSAQSYFNLIERGYTQGIHSLIEYLDARNQLTSSQLQRNLRWFEMLTALVKLERETAAYSFTN